MFSGERRFLVPYFSAINEAYLGKTTALLRALDRAIFQQKQSLLVKRDGENRAGEAFVGCHDKNKRQAGLSVTDVKPHLHFLLEFQAVFFDEACTY